MRAPVCGSDRKGARGRWGPRCSIGQSGLPSVHVYAGPVVRSDEAAAPARWAGGRLQPGTPLRADVRSPGRAGNDGCVRCPSGVDARRQTHRRPGVRPLSNLLARLAPNGEVRVWRRAPNEQRQGRVSGRMVDGAIARTRPLHLLRRRGLRRLFVEPSDPFVRGRAQVRSSTPIHRSTAQRRRAAVRKGGQPPRDVGRLRNPAILCNESRLSSGQIRKERQRAQT
jgi:hypothetical protein